MKPKPIIIKQQDDPTAFETIMWLFRFPYNLTATSDYFYYYTIHSERGWLISTDGLWMRMVQNEGSEEGDFAVKMVATKECNHIELIPKLADKFWHFPATWKRILNPLVPPKNLGDFQFKHLIRYLYKNDHNVPFNLLSQLEEGTYTLNVWKEAGLVVLEQKDLKRVTVMAVDEDTPPAIEAPPIFPSVMPITSKGIQKDGFELDKPPNDVLKLSPTGGRLGVPCPEGPGFDPFLQPKSGGYTRDTSTGINNFGMTFGRGETHEDSIY